MLKHYPSAHRKVQVSLNYSNAISMLMFGTHARQFCFCWKPYLTFQVAKFISNVGKGHSVLVTKVLSVRLMRM